MTECSAATSDRLSTAGAGEAPGRAGASRDCASHTLTGRARCAAVVSRRRMFVALHLLHARPSPVGTRRVRTHGGRACRAPVPVATGFARVRCGQPDDHLFARAPLTTENHRDLLERARNRSKREVEHIVAALRPQPSVPSTLRKVPASGPHPSIDLRTSGAIGVIRRADCSTDAQAPIAPEQFKVQFTVSRET